MQTFKEKLQQFGLAAADLLGVLITPPASATLPTESTEAALQHLRVCNESVQALGQLAWDCGLPGVQSVCALIETNLMLLQGEDRPLTADEMALLEGWPSLLIAYLEREADHDSSLALLQSLSVVWPMTLSAESIAEELNSLMEPAASVTSTVVGAADDLPPELAAQQVDPVMLAILVHELEQMSQDIDADLSQAVQGDAALRQAALNNFGEFLDRLGTTVESVGLSGLAAWFAQLRQRVSSPDTAMTPALQALLHQLPEYLSSYLADPLDAAASAQLVALLTHVELPNPLSAAVAPQWQAMLSNVALIEGDAGHMAPRQKMATAEDVSLRLSDEVNPELLEGLLQELPVQVEAFTAAISRMASGKGSLPDAERAMRSAHTLKGAANTVGVPGIANLTHHLEDILVALIEAEKMPSRELGGVLVNAGDCLEAMNEYLLGQGPEPEQSLQVLQEVLDCANIIDEQGVEAYAGSMRTPVSVQEEIPPLPVKGGDTTEAAPAGVVEQAMRVPASVVDELLRLAGETLISNSQIQENLRRTVEQSATIRKQHQLFHDLVMELEELVDIRGVTSAQKTPDQKADDFDALEFEHYSELHTITRRLIEAATDAHEMGSMAGEQLMALEELLEAQRRLQMANQHAVMRTRMVAVSSVISRLQRGVRQAGRLLDKPVQLSVQGENTNIDSHVLNDLMDPLMHLLRNAVDHGIESTAVREAAGKPAEGHIELSFSREGNTIVVRCKDDGGGLDYEAIRQIAERKGMVLPEHDHTEDELARLILSPGFSTRSEASQISGRGVGMDVVYSRVLEMKGMLALNSQRGKGMMVELRLPVSLLSAHALIVREQGRNFALSSRGVEDIRYVPASQISKIGTRQFFRDGEQVYNLELLKEMLSLPEDRRKRKEGRDGYPVLLVRQDDGSATAVLVEELLNSREVVMKSLGHYVPNIQGVVAAVILGNGGVAPVIDLVDMLRAPAQNILPMQEAMLQEAMAEGEAAFNRRILVVDDSLSARRALVQVLKDAGYDIRTANDGMDAVTILENYVPDIILTDMEMPRMNGLELTANIRHAAHTKHIPVIMITSRSTEKHRQMGEAVGVNIHITKPFSDDVLLKHVAELTGK